ncbi:MAG: NAD(P)-dependent oxidoreductase [Oceanospirillaceae bacterium]
MIIAFIGTGLMGLPMASNLLRAGFRVNAYNRSIEKTAPLAELNAKICSSAEQAINNADIIVTMLENEQAQETVLFNANMLSFCKKNCLIIDMASILPATAIAHAALADQYNVQYLDAPVSGGTQGAINAELVIMVGGSAENLSIAQPVLRTLGTKIVHIGPVGSGQIAKCANQAIVAITIGAVSEALLLAHSAGANTQAVREALLGGFAASKVLDQHGLRMLERNFVAGGTARVQLKDLTNILQCAEQNNLELPLTQSVTHQYQALNSAGYQDLDHSALLLLLEKNNNTILNNN